MAGERDALRDWHRLFGLLLTDLFADLPFRVEIERDLSQQQQFLDVVIVRRGRGRVVIRLPDGLDDLAAHNLITFKSYHEALDSWAMKELIGHDVAYRKLVSPSPSALLPEDHFRLYAVCARFPENLARQVPWQERRPGVYDCTWGTDTVRVVVAGQLPRVEHNAPLHLFSASPELVGFGRSAYRQQSQTTSRLLGQLFERFRVEGLAMSYTMEDFERDYFLEHFAKLPPERQREVLQSLPLAKRRKMLASLPLAERCEMLEPEDREMLESLPLTELRELLQSLELAERREMLASLPLAERREMLASLPPAERREMLASLPLAERREMLASLPLEERLAGLSQEQIRQYLDKFTPGRAAGRKPRRAK